MEQERLRNIKLVLEYDGANLAGWQRQPDRETVQGLLEDALYRIIGEKITVIGAGRTDAGVHARGQTANFKTSGGRSLEEILNGANALLPPEIAVLSASEAPLDFHARYSARSKVYDYDIFVSPVRPALKRHYVWHISRPLDLEAMARALKSLLGEHDFAGFQSVGTKVSSTVRRMIRAEVIVLPGGLVRITMEADGFLRHMVRAIVGTLVLVGQGRMSQLEFEGILQAKNRSLAGATAPASGLCLREVLY
ncbi:MAG: tRNA pseudouridine(38-40) synthase TruA [Pseudomonadota bacterium]